MGIIGNNMSIKQEQWVNFWEVLEGIISTVLSILGSGLVYKLKRRNVEFMEHNRQESRALLQSIIPYSKKHWQGKALANLVKYNISPSFFTNFHYFHNISYANGLQFTKVFPQTSYSPYLSNFFISKVFTVR